MIVIDERDGPTLNIVENGFVLLTGLVWLRLAAYVVHL